MNSAILKKANNREELLKKKMMPCPVCAHENPDGVRFCVKCGWQLIQTAGGQTNGLFPAPEASPAIGDKAMPAAREAAPPTTALTHQNADTQEFTPQDFLVLVVDDTVDNLVILSLHLQQ
ncbi:MAG: zinc ribbon domain-containing protein, partial [Acidobacteria bacterium]|nr:zinc ribbon domain-containing protein [Acidobacteriota bacterium]